MKDRRLESFKNPLTQLPIVKDETLEDMKLVYGIWDDEIIQRLWVIKLAIKEEKQNNMRNDELISFLISIMNYGDMQIWLMDQRMKGVNLSLNEKLKKFFELKSDQDILGLYDVEQNYNQDNINGIRKTLKK